MKYLSDTSPRTLDPALVADVRREFGAAVPPFMLHAPAPELFAAVWVLCRETLLVGTVPRARKEAVASVVSRLNRCPYCVDAHVTMLDALRESALADTLSDSTAIPVASDPLLRWAAATRSPGDPLLALPPFTSDEAPEIVGTALCFHYINRMVSVLLEPSPLPELPLVPKRWSRRMAGRYFGFAARRRKAPGESLRHVAHVVTTRPPSAWTARNPSVARATAVMQRVIDEIEARAIGAPLRDWLAAELVRWRGENAPLGTEWVERSLAPLDAALRGRARLALLTALAPHQVHESVVDEARTQDASDRALVELLAWASWRAAERIETWLAPRSS